MNYSLKSKIIGLVLVISALLGGGAFFNLGKLSGDYEESKIESLGAFSRALGEKIGAQFFERYGDVQAFAMNPFVASFDKEQLPKTLDAYIALYGIYDLIVIVDKNGKFVASNTKDYSGKSVDLKSLEQLDFSDQPWFKSVLNGKTTDDKENNFSGTFFEDFIADSMQKAAFAETRYGSSFSAPIKNDQGEVVGVISNRAGSRWLDSEFKSVYVSLKETKIKSARFQLLNKDGLILIDYDPIHNGGNEEVLYNSEKILKENLFQSKDPIGLEIQKTSDDSLIVDNAEGIAEVLSYHKIKNSKWIKDIGWTVVLREDAKEALSSVASSKFSFYLIFGFNILIALIGAIFFALNIAKKMNGVVSELDKSSIEVASGSTNIASQATELSEASTEQAAAIQETVAAIDEISAMVDKNADSARRSREVSGSSRQAAEKGRETVQNMVKAINDIDHSNKEISQQMDSSNKQLSEIINLINDIGTKTKVINEIVFQTKLLSFNASVEAARAGEYGKGFSVVAEEVGNLAQMSGSAAKEITSMLENSVKKVETIVSETQSRVNSLMSSAKDKIQVGSSTAKECDQALNTILESVSSVDGLVAEISVASDEQATGIKEISKAVAQMDQVTQKNSASSQACSAAAEQLNSQADTLKSIVSGLTLLVQGSNQKSPVALASSSRSSNVIELKSRKPKVERKSSSNSDFKITESSKASETKVEATDLKMASGGDSSVPSSNDPGFGDS